MENPEKVPVDIVGEVSPNEALLKLVDQGLGYFNEDDEFCLRLPAELINKTEL